MSGELYSLEGFRGVARLFPLPDLVLFPSVVQPLHIFEPRYRAMLADALQDDRLLGMALLQPGWEEDYEGRPPVHPIACLGRIFNEQQLADGRSNLLLQGLVRMRILEELPADRLYREARVELLEDVAVSSPAEEQGLRDRLRVLVPRLLEHQGGAVDQGRKLLESELSLGCLCDIFAFALPLETPFKQQLLEELAVSRRVRLLLAHLEGLLPRGSNGQSFPPGFSDN